MIRSLTAASLLLALGACHDRGAIQSASGRLVSASSSWNTVGTEFAASCRRQTQFGPGLGCARSQAATDGLIAANKIISIYFGALADAASDQSFTVQPGLDDAAGAVGRIPGVNADEVSAASGLVGLLARLATDAARERTLRSLIGEGAPAARRLVGLLARAVPPALTTTLNAERDQLDFQYSAYVQRGGAMLVLASAGGCTDGPKAGALSAVNFLLASDYCRRALALQAKLEAVVAYRESLSEADRILAELESSKTKLSAKALAVKLYKMGKELDDSVAAIRKAFAQEQAA